jgi:SagB-type dehydrogenase family enzyme
MKIIKLKQPFPRVKQSVVQPSTFFYTGFLPLPKIAKVSWPKLDSVLKTRHSGRDFRNPLSFQQLAALVWHSARLREKRYLENGTMWQSKVAPSGGGCHPIHIAVLRAPDFPRDILVYDSEHNGFGVVGSVEPKLLQRAVKETETCLRLAKGTVLWFFADVAKTYAKYHNPESLIWRDSGALLAIVNLVADALALESCGLGIHETPSLRRALNLPASVIGVGGCVVAETPDEKRRR